MHMIWSSRYGIQMVVCFVLFYLLATLLYIIIHRFSLIWLIFCFLLQRAASKRQTSKNSKGKRYFSTLFVKGIEEVAELIKTRRCTNIIVMAGAGISTPSGIPDFR